MARREITLDPLTTLSLFIQPMKNGNVLGSATGFVVEHHNASYLVTNWHVLAGKNPETGEQLARDCPTDIAIWHHREPLGHWQSVTQPLFDRAGNHLWVEHPQGNNVDVVALPLDLSHGTQTFPLDLSLADVDMAAYCAMPVHILGFPLGLAASGRFPIWKTGHIASEPEIDVEGRPLFLIDATTRGGMSGSPVFARQVGSRMDRAGNLIVQPGMFTRFLGIYAGRIGTNVEVGRVWKPGVIAETVEGV